MRLAFLVRSWHRAAGRLFRLGGRHSGGGAAAKQGLEPRRAHATSIAIILPLSLISLIVYWLNGNLPLTQSLPFFVPALLGSAAGAALLKKIPVQLLKLVFAGLILYSGIRLLMR